MAEVLADVSRYSDIKIELADPALADLPVGGAFRTDQIEAIFAALENNFGMHAEWVDPQHVRFSVQATRRRLPELEMFWRLTTPQLFRIQTRILTDTRQCPAFSTNWWRRHSVEFYA